MSKYVAHNVVWGPEHNSIWVDLRQTKRLHPADLISTSAHRLLHPLREYSFEIKQKKWTSLRYGTDRCHRQTHKYNYKCDRRFCAHKPEHTQTHATSTQTHPNPYTHTYITYTPRCSSPEVASGKAGKTQRFTKIPHAYTVRSNTYTQCYARVSVWVFFGKLSREFRNTHTRTSCRCSTGAIACCWCYNCEQLTKIPHTNTLRRNARAH